MFSPLYIILVFKYLHVFVHQVLDPIDEVIPEDMHDFLSAHALYDELVDLLIGEPIEKSKSGTRSIHSIGLNIFYSEEMDWARHTM